MTPNLQLRGSSECLLVFAAEKGSGGFQTLKKTNIKLLVAEQDSFQEWVFPAHRRYHEDIINPSFFVTHVQTESKQVKEELYL